MSEPLIVYTPRPDATSAAELGALDAIYKLCMSNQAKKKPAGATPAKTMQGRSKMLAPALIVHNTPSLLGDVRQALSLRPDLADYPARLAEHLETDERAVCACVEALYLEGVLCP